MQTKTKTTAGTAAANRQWFDVDRAGLAKVLRRKGVEFALFELIQNAWDEKGVTNVRVDFGYGEGTDRATLRVEDDAPEGFSKLSHAYTLFAESVKKADPEKRGRFNLGEKLVLALCDTASVTTTKGTVAFDDLGRHEHDAPRRSAGSVFECVMRITRKEFDAACAAVDRLIPPATIETRFNDKVLATRTPVATVRVAELPTEAADDEGALRKVWRSCDVRCYEVGADETATIYEMGIPVVEHDCQYHVDVSQKVPLTLDRENVTVNFLNTLRVALFNGIHGMLDASAMNASWVQTAMESPNVTKEAAADYVTKRFGETRVSYDPSDREANKLAVSGGYQVVHSGHMSKAVWDNVRKNALIAPAGKVTPSAKVWADDALAAAQVAPIPEDKWTPDMKAVAEYAKRFAEETISVDVSVSMFSTEKMLSLASYGGRRLSFNKFRLGGRWFDLKSNRVAIDDLIIHELAHELSGDHLSDEYYRALTKIGAMGMKACREGRLS
jgi:hypothetical protein